MERRTEATIPLDDWCGAHRRSGPIVGKPGAWRNRSVRCVHHVDRSVTRCWMCERRLLAATQRDGRFSRCYSREQRMLLLGALAKGDLTVESASEVVGIEGEPLHQLIRVLRSAGYIRSDNSSTLSLTRSGRVVYGECK